MNKQVLDRYDMSFNQLAQQMIIIISPEGLCFNMVGASRT